MCRHKLTTWVSSRNTSDKQTGLESNTHVGLSCHGCLLCKCGPCTGQAGEQQCKDIMPGNNPSKKRKITSSFSLNVMATVDLSWRQTSYLPHLFVVVNLLPSSSICSCYVWYLLPSSSLCSCDVWNPACPWSPPPPATCGCCLGLRVVCTQC